MPLSTGSLSSQTPLGVSLDGPRPQTGLRPQSAPLRANPLDGNPLPTNAVEARNNGRFQVQSNTNWFSAAGAKAAVVPYALAKGAIQLVSLPLKVLDFLFCKLPSRALGTLSNLAQGLQRADRSNFQVQVPGATAGQGSSNLNLDGMMLPKLVPRGMDAAELREQVQIKIDRGHDILESVRNGTREAPATKQDVSDIAFYLQARGQLANNGEAFSEGAFTIPDPGCRIRNFLDSSPDAYQRASSHTSRFQALDGARHRGIDLPGGGGASLDEAMPYGMETLLYGSLPEDTNMRMPEDRLFLKMESHGAWLSKPSPGYEPAGPRRTANRHDVGAFLGHACSFLASRGQGSAAGSRKERIPEGFKTEFRQLLKDAPNSAERLRKGDPMDSSMGIRVAYRNAQVALLEAGNDRPAERHALEKFIAGIEGKYSRPDVRIGNEIILENHATGASLGDALDSLGSEQPNQRLVLGGLMQFARQTDQAWAEHTAKKQTERFDAGAQQHFATGRMQAEVARLDDAKARQALQQLEGAFGNRTMGMCEFVVQQLSGIVDKPNHPEAGLLSRMTRMGMLMGGLIDQLKSRLNLEEAERHPPTSIDSADELRPIELAALAHIGVEAKHL